MFESFATSVQPFSPPEGGCDRRQAPFGAGPVLYRLADKYALPVRGVGRAECLAAGSDGKRREWGCLPSR